ncbi:META domain-containing protein [Parasphingorhabdus sp.]|uniref:META domain-containing protein n=1 Tax=Parasphingorhabdus sp. TaxID=2709688 RepID=UPI003A8D9326|tara:strand:+ start:534 stop:1004 length:471 start_codon:yes stop_codon:yes gene_type:complete
MKTLMSLVFYTSALAMLSACKTMAPEAPAANMPFSGLEGTNWRLVEFQSMDDAQGATRPDDSDKYTITFHNDGSLSARFDCNRGMGPWRNDIANATGGTLAIGPLGVTKALCPEPSMGEMLERQLGYVRSFTITENRLNMALMADGGIIVWEPKPY